jgi:hypothetical protein
LWIMTLGICAVVTVIFRLIPREYRTGISGLGLVNSQRTYTIVPTPKKWTLPSGFFTTWKQVDSRNISSILPPHLLKFGFDIFSIFSGRSDNRETSAIHARLWFSTDMISFINAPAIILVSPISSRVPGWVNGRSEDWPKEDVSVHRNGDESNSTKKQQLAALALQVCNNKNVLQAHIEDQTVSTIFRARKPLETFDQMVQNHVQFVSDVEKILSK